MFGVYMERPWYLKPPLRVLFELHRLRRLYPWDVDLSFLLSYFLKEMEKRGEVDFRASGVALDSSASIYLMKSKLLLKLEEPPKEPEPRPDFIPPPLALPIRYELTTTTIQHLLAALDETLSGERFFTVKPRLEPVLPSPSEIVPAIEAYLIEIEELMSRLYRKLQSLAREGVLITFSRVVEGLDRMGRIKTFITLLFMAQKGKVTLWQEEEFGEIFITLAGG
mgnify:CR=1 FL=1